MTLHPAVIGLQCKEEGRDPDGQGADKGQLQGQKGIREARKQTDQRKQQGENIFYQEQGSGPLDVVYDSSSFAYDCRHGLEIGIQQHKLGDLTGGLAAGSHGDAAVGFLQRQHIIHAVAGHGNGMAVFLHGSDQPAFLFRSDTAEDLVFFGSGFQAAVRF